MLQLLIPHNHNSEMEGRRDNPTTRCCDEHPFPPRAADMGCTIIVPVVWLPHLNIGLRR
jgi:hypothetical protein